MPKPMFLWVWLAVEHSGRLVIADTPLTDRVLADWRDRFRSYTYWAGQVPQC
jgi:hypothetical protein